ncbi:MAG: Uma2 family endonuclease [Sporomusaceae bacterium]|jgi:Uma2 family endonuclease|nr:Uma2 family endonuclease [Sporomusaceae bacterium]
MNSNAVRDDLFYTYEDYAKLDADQRYEVINGAIYLMTSPNRKHQRISGNLFRKIGNYLEGKKCEVYNAPFDVILPKKGETKKTASTIIQPDIFVVCDENKLDDNSCVGAPDLIIEILSPSSVKLDKIIKRSLYELHGVKEYWLVDPVHQIIDRFYYDEVLKEYKKPESFSRDDVITPMIFPDLPINLAEIFPETIKEN